MKRVYMRMMRVIFLLAFFVAWAGCSSDQEVKVYASSFSFEATDQGWTGDFADHPLDTTEYHLQFGLDTLPYKINPDSTKKGLRISGINRSDDLFMFIKKKMTGLRKNTTYQLLFNVRLASDAPTDNVGIGGAPGESVYVKVGGSTQEPVAELVNEYYLLNLDKGNQAEGGANMVPIGHVGVAPTTVDYTLITRYNNRSNSVLVTSDEAGELWVLVGTDSGFEGKTTLYYTQVQVILNEVD